MRRIVKENEPFPKWYAPAYPLYYMKAYVAYPFPFNLFVRWFYDFWHWINRNNEKFWHNRTLCISRYWEGYWKGHFEREKEVFFQSLIQPKIEE